MFLSETGMHIQARIFISYYILILIIQITGSLVLLSHEGELACCYLGTKPTLFVAPPLENSVTNFKNVSKKLESLQENIRQFKQNNGKWLMISLPGDTESRTFYMSWFHQ